MALENSYIFRHYGNLVIENETGLNSEIIPEVTFALELFIFT